MRELGTLVKPNSVGNAKSGPTVDCRGKREATQKGRKRGGLAGGNFKRVALTEEKDP